MKRQKNKIMVIVALCVAVLCLTLGFAAFSNSLTISSSANVTPSMYDFSIQVKGMHERHDSSTLGGSYYGDFHTELVSKSLYEATDFAEPIIEYRVAGATADAATISSDTYGNVTISNLNVVFTKPDQQVQYYFIIENTGSYDAYLNVANISVPEAKCSVKQTTNPDEQANADLVAKACAGIKFTGGFGFLSSDGTFIDTDISKYMDNNYYVKIPKDGYAYAAISFDYLSTAERADGPFDVSFNDFVLTFSTTNGQ